jgi:hypothetical protein
MRQRFQFVVPKYAIIKAKYRAAKPVTQYPSVSAADYYHQLRVQGRRMLICSRWHNIGRHNCDAHPQFIQTPLILGSLGSTPTMEVPMRKVILAFVGSAAIGTFAMVAKANAVPIGPASPVASTVEQVRLVCDEWGRCWRRRDYYRPYDYYDGYYRPRYRYYGPRYYGGYGYGYGGWHRGWYGY